MRIFNRSENKGNYRSFTMKVSGLHCYGCNKNVEASLSKMKGIQNVRADFTKQEVKMEFDESTVNVEKIRNAITKAGYIPGAEQTD